MEQCKSSSSLVHICLVSSLLSSPLSRQSTLDDFTAVTTAKEEVWTREGLNIRLENFIAEANVVSSL